MSSKAKQILLWLVIISSAMVFAYFLQSKQDKTPQDLSFDQSLTQIRNKDIKEITLKQNVLELVDKNGVKFTANLDTSDAPRESILKAADDTGTKVNLEPASSGWGWILLINALPFILLIGILVFPLWLLLKLLLKRRN